jgi:hypothetical protein
MLVVSFAGHRHFRIILSGSANDSTSRASLHFAHAIATLSAALTRRRRRARREGAHGARHLSASLNALVAGCNQKTSRAPMMDEHADVGRARRAARAVARRRARAGACALRAQPAARATTDRTALVATLMRGSQTPGELDQRVERLAASDLGPPYLPRPARRGRARRRQPRAGRAREPLDAPVRRTAGGRAHDDDGDRGGAPERSVAELEARIARSGASPRSMGARPSRE